MQLSETNLGLANHHLDASAGMHKCNHASYSYHVHSTCSKAMCLVVLIFMFIPYNNEVLQSDWSIAGVIFHFKTCEYESSA